MSFVGTYKIIAYMSLNDKNERVWISPEEHEATNKERGPKTVSYEFKEDGQVMVWYSKEGIPEAELKKAIDAGQVMVKDNCFTMAGQGMAWKEENGALMVNMGGWSVCDVHEDGSIEFMFQRIKNVDEGAIPKQTESKNIYQNEFLGYSIELPKGFKPQNRDKEMEESRGGKLFFGCDGNATIDITSNDHSQAIITPEEQLQLAEAFLSLDNNETLLSKEVTARTIAMKWKDEEGIFRGNYTVEADKRNYVTTFWFAASKEKEFNEAFDLIVSTLKY